MSSDNRWIFENRWTIEGTLTTRSFLHIGCGDTIDLILTGGKKEREDKKKEPVKINAVISDCNGKPFIPGSTMKGNLRSWLDGRIDNTILEGLLGSKLIRKGGDVVGGKIEFHGAFMCSEAPPGHRTSNYNPETATDITVGVAMDRRTRTVSDGKLFQQSVVPSGACFKVFITGQNLEEEEMSSLLYGLTGFNDTENPLGLGAGTADGWGQLNWKLDKVGFVGREETQKWLQETPATVGYGIVGQDRTDEFRRRVSGYQPVSKGNDFTLRLDIELEFDGQFLVNDPGRKINDGPAKTTDHLPRLGADGKAILPASSFRGAFRSQAERIIRTLDKHACRVDDTSDRCKPIYSFKEKGKLCLACQTFGAAGWKTPVTISDFVQTGNASELTQEFVAIDRFTGGSRDGAKFNAEAVLSPIFTGSITVDLNRISSAETGLLALAIKDLVEGDVTLGFGSAKGYGACTAKITQASLSYAPEWCKSLGVAGINWKEGDESTALLEAAARCVQMFCEVAK